MQEVASEVLARSLAKREFKKAATKKRTWRDKGRGRDKKLKEFRNWARRELRRKQEKVYVFWRRHECRYVGRTRGWFNGTTRIDVHSTRQKRSTPSLERLAIHHFQPTKNKMKAHGNVGRQSAPFARSTKRRYGRNCARFIVSVERLMSTYSEREQMDKTERRGAAVIWFRRRATR